MTHRAEARRTISVPADDLWRTVSRIDGMEDWYPDLIQSSNVPDPDAVQPRRECVMANGGELKERILVRDGATRTFVYAIDEHPMPARNVVGTIRIDDLGDGRSSVSWASDLVLTRRMPTRCARWCPACTRRAWKAWSATMPASVSPSSIEALSIEANANGPWLKMLRADAAGPKAANRPPILFLHGYTSGAWQFAARVMPALAADGWTTYALNLRGHGGSDGREGVRKARFADYASDVARGVAFVERESGTTPILIGHSLGSVLARDHASRHAVPGLGLLSFGDIALGMRGFMGWMMPKFPVQGMVGMMTGRPSAMFARFEPQYAVMYEGHPREAVRENVERLMAQPDSDKVFMELRKLTIGKPEGDPPLLIMAGDNDSIASPKSVRALAEAYGTQPILLPNQAHDILAGPDWTIATGRLKAWLRDLASETGA